jgi:hypothetical protein
MFPQAVASLAARFSTVQDQQKIYIEASPATHSLLQQQVLLFFLAY